jgi:hypothetical protein
MQLLVDPKRFDVLNGKLKVKKNNNINLVFQ